MNALLLSVPLAPLTVSLIVGLFIKKHAGWLNVLGAGLALLALLLIGRGSPAFSSTWFEVGAERVTLGLSLDGLARFMAFLVAGVGLLVSVYAVGYMRGEAGRPRFFSTLAFFLGAMLTLVLANSFALLFAAWEAVGLASYLLIGFHYREDRARKAALRAFLMTRVGDVGLLLGWLLALGLTGTSDIPALLGSLNAIPAATLALLAGLFLLGAVGKSAQLPLSAWLPSAMVGPTPVSALLHSATMVAAGVYLLLRLSPLFAAAPGVLIAVAWVGGLSALFAALVATVQSDLKRVLAWSTVSQLGEMFFAYGLGSPFAAAYHLGVHALFKSALFLSAGSVQHAAGTLDMRKLGGLGRTMPFTALTFALAGLTLAGFPPFGAYWSEEAILGRALDNSVWTGLLLLLLVFLAGSYIARAGVATFRPKRERNTAHEVGPLMTWPALALAALALFGGVLGGLLPFARAPEVPLPWRLAAVAASLLGLIWGGVRAARLGAAPAFGPWPRALGGALEGLTAGAARLAMAGSSGLRGVEGSLDAAARHLGRAALDAGGGVARSEVGIDAAGRAVADAALAGARLSARAEEGGFAFGADRLASWVGTLGGWLRGLESGKVYLYTLVIFAWVLAAALGAMLWR